MVHQILLFDQPRSASSLLQRIFSKQSNLKLLDHPFSQARGDQVEWLRQQQCAEGMPEVLQSSFKNGVKEAVTVWQKALSDAQNEGRTLMVHDHPFIAIPPNYITNVIKNGSASTSIDTTENFTMIPTSILLQSGTVAILTIRDPRLSVPSAYRVLRDMNLPHGSGRPNFLVSTTPLWNRMLYDFLSSNGMAPIVVDADDIMTNTEFLCNLCRHLDLDPDQLHFSWPPPSQEEKAELHPMYFASQKTLIESSGIDSTKAVKNTDLDMEMQSWEADFGEDIELVKEMVELAMPHYEYLYEQRLKL